VVPVVYTFLDDLGGAFVRWWGRKQKVAEATVSASAGRAR
jgi:hypothetical protein